MSNRHLPVRPDLTQLKHQAKDLLRAIKRGDAEATADFREQVPGKADPSTATLSDAQLALARSYGVASWPRLVAACQVVDAIWADDLERLRELIAKRPALLHEMARGTRSCNWGPPMSYAANLGRDNMIKMLRELGAKDVRHAAGRAALQGHIGTARLLYEMAGSPPAPRDAVMGPCEALNPEGLAFVLEIGGGISDLHRRLARPDRLAPRNLFAKPGGQASMPRDHGRARHHPSRHPADGRASRSARSARASSAAPIRTCSGGRSRTPNSSPRSSDAGRTGRWRLSARRLAGRRSCTCASITANSRSPSGCSTAAWT